MFFVWLRNLLLLVLFLFHSQAWSARVFTVYAFLPWKGTPQLSDYGIKPIKVIYEAQMFTDGKIDKEKLNKIALDSMVAADIPVSFDIELGNRFKPETVLPIVQELLQTYAELKPKSLIGVYGILPQNIYSWKSNTATFDALNKKYKSLINYVDFISPVLYNYDGKNLQAWAKSADYAMKAAKRYAAGKPIIPYISPIIKLRSLDEIKNGTLVEELDEESMAARLQILYDLGASGCIIWASSQNRTKEGQFPLFDPGKAWGRAVVTFIKSH